MKRQALAEYKLNSQKTINWALHGLYIEQSEKGRLAHLKRWHALINEKGGWHTSEVGTPQMLARVSKG